MLLDKRIKVISSVILFLVCFSQAAFKQYSFQEQWQGNCLWIGSEQNPQVPAGWIDPAKWIVLFPGSWQEPMVLFAISSPSNAGLQKIYWDVYNADKMVLYPSDSFKDKVYKNLNSGYDFYATDMAGIAGSVASLDNIELRYTVWWNDGTVERDIIEELLNKYPHTDIAVVTGFHPDQAVREKLAQELSHEQLERIEIINSMDRMIDLTNCDRDPLKSHDFHKQLLQKYLHFGKVVFKREIEITDASARCTVAVSGRNKWHLFVNDKFVSSGIWKNGTWQDMAFLSGTYEITDLIKPGINTIAVCVESGYNERAFMANIRIGDMIYRCDDHWKAMSVKDVPSETELEQLCNQKERWQTPLILARPNIWPNTMGKIYWHRLYPWQNEIDKQAVVDK